MITQHESGSYFDTEDPGEPGYAGKVPRLSVTDEECAFLTHLAYARNVLEIGTGLAVSTKALAHGADHVVTVDPDPWVREHVWPRLAGWNVRWLESLAELKTRNHCFASLAFIDGNHKFDSVVADLRSVLPFLADGALIVLHDIKASSVELAARSVFSKVRIIDTTHGLGLCWLRDMLP